MPNSLRLTVVAKITVRPQAKTTVIFRGFPQRLTKPVVAADKNAENCQVLLGWRSGAAIAAGSMPARASACKHDFSTLRKSLR